MQKHGGQTYEGPEEILVCIVDDSYGKPSDLDEEQQYEWYKAQLEKDFSQKFEEVDVAPGYSLPAFATIVQIATEYWPALVATFFLAKPVSENLETWRNVANSIKKYFSRPDVVLGRNAAGALAVEAVFNDLGGIPKKIECLQYFWRDRRFKEDDFSNGELIQDGPRTEYLSMAVHFYRIRADGIEFEVEIKGKTVHAKRV
jgi:hypothetical protein